jgi:hypothetical protein
MNMPVFLMTTLIREPKFSQVLAFRLYNECLQKGKAKAFKHQQDTIYHRLAVLKSKSIPMENKYLFMLYLLKINRTLYEFVIKKLRK